MTTRSVILFVAETPAKAIVPHNIILHQHTWFGHIKIGHPEVDLDQVQDTLSDPDYICDSRTRPGDWVFVCEGNTNDYGEGIRVAVRHQDGMIFVTSAYYSGSPYLGTVLWRRGDG